MQPPCRSGLCHTTACFNVCSYTSHFA